MSATQLTWPQVLGRLIQRENLPREYSRWAMTEIMGGNASPAQIAGFAIALHAKGETVAEVDGMVAAMYEYATPIEVPGPTVDIVGTGGDRAHTVNISTMASLVIAGAGERVVKHGNRAASSKCGSADVIEELGVRLDQEVPVVAAMAESVGITFCYAPRFHPSLRFAAATRRELGVPTTFNFLGPLANPARPSAQAVGVADERVAEIIAGVLARRGTAALVFRGDDGLDEFTTTTTSRVWEVRDGAIEEHVLDPVALGIEPVDPQALHGGNAAYNADVVRRVIAGEPGPVRETVALNAAAGLLAAAPREQGTIEQRLAHTLERARAALDSGSAADVLDRWVAASR